MVLKETYFKKVFVKVKVIKQYYNELEECNLGLVKVHRWIIKLKKSIICQIYKKKNIFDWDPK